MNAAIFDNLKNRLGHLLLKQVTVTGRTCSKTVINCSLAAGSPDSYILI